MAPVPGGGAASDLENRSEPFADLGKTYALFLKNQTGLTNK